MNRNCYRCLAVLTTGDADGLCSSCREKITNQAYQKIPNIVTEQIVIETKTSARMIPVTADKDSIDEINRALEIAKKEHDLLELYQLKDELKEHYAVNDSVLKGQEILDRLRQVCEEINIKEKELEEMK